MILWNSPPFPLVPKPPFGNVVERKTPVLLYSSHFSILRQLSNTPGQTNLPLKQRGKNLRVVKRPAWSCSRPGRSSYALLSTRKLTTSREESLQVEAETKPWKGLRDFSSCWTFLTVIYLIRAAKLPTFLTLIPNFQVGNVITGEVSTSLWKRKLPELVHYEAKAS